MSDKYRRGKKARLYLTAWRKKRRGPNLKKWREGKEKKKDNLEENDHPTESPNLSIENNGFGLGGRRIVNISYFMQQLMQLNQHSSSGCSLNNMTIVSETRTGLASELKFKCSICDLEKLVWTDNVSSLSPVTCTAAINEIKNGFSPVDELLDALNVVSVPINASTAELDRVQETSDRSEMRKTLEIQKQLAFEEEEGNDAEEFSVVVEGTRTKRTQGTSPFVTSLEKRPETPGPEHILGLGLGSSSMTKTVTPSIMTIEVDPRSLITPDIDVPDSSVPGPSRQIKPDTSTMATMCESYDSDAFQPDFFPKIKKEPIDPYKYKHVSPIIVLESNSFSTIRQESSLFRPPALIKEEQIYFEEDS